VSDGGVVKIANSSIISVVHNRMRSLVGKTSSFPTKRSERHPRKFASLFHRYDESPKWATRLCRAVIIVGGRGRHLCNLHNHTSLPDWRSKTEFAQEGLFGSSPSRLPQAKVCPFRELLINLDAQHVLCLVELGRAQCSTAAARRVQHVMMFNVAVNGVSDRNDHLDKTITVLIRPFCTRVG
jgi:hypothetical protein